MAKLDGREEAEAGLAAELVLAVVVAAVVVVVVAAVVLADAVVALRRAS